MNSPKSVDQNNDLGNLPIFQDGKAPLDREIGVDAPGNERSLTLSAEIKALLANGRNSSSNHLTPIMENNGSSTAHAVVAPLSTSDSPMNGGNKLDSRIIDQRAFEERKVVSQIRRCFGVKFRFNS